MANKKVFLYVGYFTDKFTKYEAYSDTDITGLHADEFVITCAGYPGYFKYDYAPEEKGGLPTPDSEKERLDRLNFYMNKQVELAVRIIRLTGKTVWFGFPQPPRPTKTITIEEYKKYITAFLDIAATLKLKINGYNKDYYYNYVQGFYMNDEHVRRHTFSTGNGIDDPYGVNTDVNHLRNHPQIHMYSEVSKALKTAAYGWKKLLWAPYMGYGNNYDTTMIDIAYIANTTDIFDTVLLQPHHYFFYEENGQEDVKKNLAVVRNSLNRQEVRRRTNSGNTDTRVVAKKSSTIIGCQMEIDESYFNEKLKHYAACRQKFPDYLEAFSGSKVTSPANRVFSFYCDQRFNGWEDAQKEVNDFFDTL